MSAFFKLSKVWFYPDPFTHSTVIEVSLLRTYLSSVSSICTGAWSLSASGCLRCLSGMIGSGAEVVGEGGLTPSRYTMAGSPLDKMSDQLW